jgi:hypothetical protein
MLLKNSTEKCVSFFIFTLNVSSLFQNFIDMVSIIIHGHKICIDLLCRITDSLQTFLCSEAVLVSCSGMAVMFLRKYA